MAKYDLEYKFKIVRSVMEEGKGIKAVAKEYGVCKGDVQKWVAAYRIPGIDGLARKKNTYTGEFKQQVVEDMRTNRMSLRQTAAKYNLEHYAISKWERIYLEEGPEGLYIDRRGQASSKGRPPKLNKAVEEDLIAEVQRLRAEVDYLKKIECLGFGRGAPRQKAQVIWELRRKHKVSLLIEISGLPRATYYY